MAVPQRFSGSLSSPQGVDDNPIILVCSRCMSQRYDCFNTDSALLYHSGWLRLVHFHHTTIIMQGDVPSAVRWCTITLQSCFITVGIYAFMISILLSLSMLLGWRLMCISFFTLWAGRKSLDHSNAHGLWLSGMRAEVSVRASLMSSSARRSFCFPNV